MFVGRESGTVQYYGLGASIPLIATFVFPFRPQMIAVNCNISRIALIDINSNLCLYDILPGEERGEEVHSQNPKAANYMVQKVQIERKDVWDVKWSDDNPDMFAIMEKTRLIVYDGTRAEDPIQTSTCMSIMSAVL